MGGKFMRRAISLVLLTAFLNLLFFEAYGQQERTSKKNDDEQKKINQQVLISQEKIELENLLSDFSIPPASISVLENALGDVNQDSVINILDLLRVRDIVIGKPSSTSQYELDEADLNYSSSIELNDLILFRDILLQKNSPPYLIRTFSISFI
jgi:hypothetical protein